MGISSLFKRSPQKGPIDLSLLGVDIHSHLLPGIDDGSKSIEHSLGMIRKFEELGFKKLVTTPHVMNGVYDNTTSVILEKLELVREAAQASGLTIQLEASAEYYFDETLFQRILQKDLLPFNGNHILFECSFRNEPQQLEDLVFLLTSSGYQPILAHFERYIYYHGSTEVAQRLRSMGVWIQLNLNSLTGHYGPEVRKQGLRMVKEKLVDVVGSDCHRIEHLHILEAHLSDKAFHDLMELPLKNASLR